MAKDERLYGRFTLDFADHPKIMPLSDAAFRALVEMTLYSRRMMTDGFLANALALAKWGASVCQELATNDAEKPSLLEVDGGFLIHDFAQHQSTKAEITALREKRKTAGQKGGQARAKQVLKQNPSKIKPETETETETYKDKKSTSEHENQPKPRQKPRTRIPDDWHPTDTHVTYAREHQLDLGREATAFMAHAQANDRLLANWNSGFTQWLTKAKPMGKVIPMRQGHRPGTNPADWRRPQQQQANFSEGHTIIDVPPF